MTAIGVRLVGWVTGGRVPVEDDDWGGVEAVIRPDGERFAVRARGAVRPGLFSHLDVVFHFDRVPEERVETGARHRDASGGPGHRLRIRQRGLRVRTGGHDPRPAAGQAQCSG